jgi:hypothetical protein
MLPVKHPVKTYRTIEEIRQRKEELIDQLQHDNEQFSSLWHQVFVSKNNSSKAEFLTGFVANSITVIDAFLMVRKLLKNYRGLFGKKRR